MSKMRLHHDYQDQMGHDTVSGREVVMAEVNNFLGVGISMPLDICHIFSSSSKVSIISY